MKKVEVNNKSKEFFKNKEENKRNNPKGTIMTEEEFNRIMGISDSIKN